MHPYRVIVHSNICLDSISTIPYDSNTLTCQYDGTNDAPRNLLHGPVTWHPSQCSPTYVYVCTYICSLARQNNCFKHLMLHQYIKNLPIAESYWPRWYPSLALAVFNNSTVPTQLESGFSTVFDSGFPGFICVKVFGRIWLRFSRLNWTQFFWRYLTQVFPTQFDPRSLTGFDSVFLTQFNSHFSTGFDSGFVQFDLTHV